MRRGIKGKSKRTNILNRPIDGKLAEKVTNKYILIVFLILFIIISSFAVAQLGVKTGLLFSVGFAAWAVVMYFISEHNRKTGEKILKKHPWKAFENRDKEL
ncbi:MAG: hypothetical protein MI756_17645 [Chromatiales bacterium]|nr:hypothetical protein [Chromatiales bacterium]